MNLYAHLTTIQDKHTKLEGLITDEMHRPSPDLVSLQTLKKQKLLLKEEMERLRTAELARMDAA